MYYPKTQLKIAASSREARQAYLLANADASLGGQAGQMVELEKLADPVKRALYDQELGFDESTISEAVQSQQNSWKGVLKYGLVCLAIFLIFGADNMVRLYGFALAPDFKEKRSIEFGEFEREDGMGRVVEVSDHRYYSVFSSSNKTWQFIFAHSTWLLQLPTVAVLIFFGMKGSGWFNRFASMRIARARMNGEDDTSERRLWVSLTALFVGMICLITFLFGYDRVVPISQ